MVECSNPSCACGRWFHLECMSLDPENFPGDQWWCSDTCSCYTNSCYCKLNRDDGVRLLECGQGVQCPNGQFFHADCVGLASEIVLGKGRLVTC